MHNPSAYKRWIRAFRCRCQWLKENTHIQQFWPEFHRQFALANFAKNLPIESDQTDSFEVFLASRHISLDKNPGLRPIGVGKVIRRIIGKAIVHSLREDVIRSVVNLQVCASHESGCEAAIHAMSQVFNEEDSEAVLLIDAFNTFNKLLSYFFTTSA